MPTIVALGANSFSGQDFIDLLLTRTDYKVVGFSRSSKRPQAFLYPRTEAQHLRLRDLYGYNLNSDLRPMIEFLDTVKPEYIVNFAAQSEVAPSWEHPEDWFQTNTVALAKLVNHLRKQSYLKKYLHISSPEVYGTCSGMVKEDAPLKPSTPYAASKAAADLMLSTYQKQFGFPLVTVRSTNVYGPRQQLWKLIPRTIISIKQQRKIQLHGGGRAIKSWIHIRDVSRGELDILERGRVGEIYHLAPTSGVSVRGTVATLAGVMGKSLEEVSEDVGERPGQDAVYQINADKAREEFGWGVAVPFSKGLQQVVAWVEENWSEIQKQPLEYVHKV